jgi:hypothetical protein
METTVTNILTIATLIPNGFINETEKFCTALAGREKLILN